MTDGGPCFEITSCQLSEPMHERTADEPASANHRSSDENTMHGLNHGPPFAAMWEKLHPVWSDEGA